MYFQVTYLGFKFVLLNCKKVHFYSFNTCCYHKKCIIIRGIYRLHIQVCMLYLTTTTSIRLRVNKNLALHGRRGKKGRTQVTPCIQAELKAFQNMFTAISVQEPSYPHPCTSMLVQSSSMQQHGSATVSAMYQHSSATVSAMYSSMVQLQYLLCSNMVQPSAVQQHGSTI